jgi:hypothetical protein
MPAKKTALQHAAENARHGKTSQDLNPRQTTTHRHETIQMSKLDQCQPGIYNK